MDERLQGVNQIYRVKRPDERNEENAMGSQTIEKSEEYISINFFRRQLSTGIIEISGGNRDSVIDHPYVKVGWRACRVNEVVPWFDK